jgi:hypothetical protein
MDPLPQVSHAEGLLDDHCRRATVAHHHGGAGDVQNGDWLIATDALDGIYAASGGSLNVCRDQVRATLGRRGYCFVFVHGERERSKAEFPKAILDQLRREKLILNDKRMHHRVASQRIGGSTTVSQPPRP